MLLGGTGWLRVLRGGENYNLMNKVVAYISAPQRRSYCEGAHPDELWWTFALRKVRHPFAQLH